MTEEIVNLYLDGLPWCRASYPIDLYKKARADGVKLSCSMLKKDGEDAVRWLQRRGMNAYLREGERRSELCEPMYIEDDHGNSEIDDFDWKRRWFGK